MIFDLRDAEKAEKGHLRGSFVLRRGERLLMRLVIGIQNGFVNHSIENFCNFCFFYQKNI